MHALRATMQFKTKRLTDLSNYAAVPHPGRLRRRYAMVPMPGVDMMTAVMSVPAKTAVTHDPCIT